MLNKKFKTGYLAPLNYDRYFKKIFSDLKIAKRFLEDFLDISIQEIEHLEKNNLLTDDSRSVKFDFRCKTENRHIIIEMQQWDKPDIIQRFFLYHAINTGLQLENLPVKHISTGSSEKEIKDYRRLVPTITLVWLVDESLNFEENFMSYSNYPDKLANFIRDPELWSVEKIKDLLLKRQEILAILNNNSNSLDFLQRNKLIFMFQHNIVKNKNNVKYQNWFELAEKTRNFNNTISDFQEYKKDPVFSEVIKRLITKFFNQEDFIYIKNTKKITEGIKEYEKGFYENGLIDGIAKSREIIEQIETEKQKAETEKTIFKLLYKGNNIEEISKITGKSVTEIKIIITD